jgi:ribonuclease P protein component
MKQFRINGIRLSSLKGYNRFSEVFFNSKKFHSDDMMLIVQFSEIDCTEAEFGISVSKKTVRTAVARNRVKRLLRESLRMVIKENYENLFFKVIILSWRKKIKKPGDIHLKDVYPNVLKLIKKAEIYRNENNSRDNQ